MSVRKTSFPSCEVVGFSFVFIVGTLLHMAYDWSGDDAIVGIFAPVNESIRELLKMVFTPGLILLFLELLFCSEIPTASFLSGKAVGIYVMCVTILGGLYSYSLVIHYGLILDVLLMVIAIALGQLVSFKISPRIAADSTAGIISLVMLVLLGASFVVFTFLPPHWEFFRDSITGAFGI
ncbi:DUF6512 family protein [Mesotoga prima]|uniref:DUF6512 family protein n=1 Tax=Mesotoga prima TaxID=1184387 RepID=UPI003898E5C1